jgi:hypothetical protein
MLNRYQREYADSLYSPEKHHALIARLERELGLHIEFRITEMPVFVSHTLRKKIEASAIAICEQCADPAYIVQSAPALEPRYTVPNEHPKPLFCTIDFAVTQNAAGEYEPKLIELQGFPSLYGYQLFYGEVAMEELGLDTRLQMFLDEPGVVSRASYLDLLKQALLGTHAPEECCLLELHPHKQKTRPDFEATRLLTGVAPTDIVSVRKEGRTLLHERNGKWIPIKRIYNRAIVDELDSVGAQLPFSWTDDLDVEWAGHPNWYFRMSKYSLPFLKHESVPQTTFLKDFGSQLSDLPADLSGFVLKPLFAFAGKGVNVHPTHDDVRAVPQDEHDKWVLQEKVTYAQSVYTPEGMNKIEIRVLLLWFPDEAKPRPLLSLLRSGRGELMGVRYNSVPWTGSSGCFFGDETIFG